jgi:hypothetical protein
MATSTVLEVDTTQSLLCLIPRLIMLDNTYYFLYAPETRIKKHVRVPIPNPRLVLDLFKQGNGKRECRQNTV